jgi:hypothetical protein
MHKMLLGHTCSTAAKRGWGGFSNGDLLRLAEPEFDLFITADQNLSYQQNLKGRRIAILLLSTNKLRPILAAEPAIITAITAMQPGDFRQVDIP